MSEPRVSVVIPTRARRDLLEQVIRPLLADAATLEVIVVVDGSEDGSLEALQRWASTDELLRPIWVEQAGQVSAWSVGAGAARGDVLLLLDDDVVSAPGLVAGHSSRHRLLERTVVVGYMPVALDTGRRPSAATRMYAQEYEHACAEYERDPSGILTHLWAGNLSLRRADFESVERIPRDFKAIRHADRDFGFHCAYAGLTATFDRSLYALHHHSREVAAFAQDAREQGAGRFWIHSEHEEFAGVLHLDDLSADLLLPLRFLVRLTRRPRAYRIVSFVLRHITKVAGRAYVFYPIELRTTRLLRRVEQQNGAAVAARERAILRDERSSRFAPLAEVVARKR